MNKLKKILLTLPILAIAFGSAAAQDTQPAPSAPRTVVVPPVREKKLANGLTVVVVEKHSSPLVTAMMLVKSGANAEDLAKAGLASTTANMLTKGTKTRTATQIAESMEFLGGSINAGAGWNNSNITATFTSDKLDRAMAILADVVLNPAFKQDEIDLVKSQAMDGLTYNLKQPGFLANYVASRYSFREHPVDGTPETINGLTRGDLVDFHKKEFAPGDSVLILTGDITPARANAIAQTLFGKWKNPVGAEASEMATVRVDGPMDREILKRILVIDLPKSGQAAVKYLKEGTKDEARSSTAYFPASVLNSVLGGGYSSRLNQEIRIKRGLSYGAGSSFAWRRAKNNFSTSTQTKNESAAEVAELVVAEVKKLGDVATTDAELGPRKLVLNGAFGSALQTTTGIAQVVSELYTFDLPASNLNIFMSGVSGVTSSQIKAFAFKNFVGGDIIIVGDAQLFMDDLKKRFPNTPIETIRADELDINKVGLRK